VEAYIDDLVKARPGSGEVTATARTSVYRYPRGYHEVGELDGWFLPEECEAIVERGVISDEEFAAARRKGPVRGVIETLYRTPQEHWVLRHGWRDSAGGIPDSYEFLTDDQALEWLTRQDYEDHVERFFGTLPTERGPGRPEISGRVQVRLGDLLERVDAYASQGGISRAHAIRRLISAGLEHEG
jgi:hypothetical protein